VAPLPNERQTKFTQLTTLQSYGKTASRLNLSLHSTLYIVRLNFVCAVTTDIDECAVNNGGCNAEATCTNSVGSFTCSCTDGYQGDGFTCTGNDRSKLACVSLHKMCQIVIN